MSSTGREAHNGRGTENAETAEDAEDAASTGARSPYAPDGGSGAATEDTERQVGAAARAFDLLHEQHSAALTRQAFLLTGDRAAARRAVAAAYRGAWERWPEVAVDPEPGGWLRAAAYAHALAPWRHSRLLRPRWRVRGSLRAAPPAERPLIEALLSLPCAYRWALLLRDGLGLSLPDTAAESEASTAATSGRLRHGRRALAEQLPELRGLTPRQRARETARLLRALTEPDPEPDPDPAPPASDSAPGCVPVRPAALLRRRSELRTRALTLASASLAGALALTTGLAFAASCEGPGGTHSSVRPSPATESHGAGARPGTAYLPELRSPNHRVRAGTSGKD